MTFAALSAAAVLGLALATAAAVVAMYLLRRTPRLPIGAGLAFRPPLRRTLCDRNFPIFPALRTGATSSPVAASIIGIPREILPGERRVAATPESIRKLIERGFELFGRAARDQDSDEDGAGWGQRGLLGRRWVPLEDTPGSIAPVRIRRYRASDKWQVLTPAAR